MLAVADTEERLSVCICSSGTSSIICAAMCIRGCCQTLSVPRAHEPFLLGLECPHSPCTGLMGQCHPTDGSHGHSFPVFAAVHAQIWTGYAHRFASKGVHPANGTLPLALYLAAGRSTPCTQSSDVPQDRMCCHRACIPLLSPCTEPWVTLLRVRHLSLEIGAGLCTSSFWRK